jgi:hypothetical protein
LIDGLTLRSSRPVELIGMLTQTAQNYPASETQTLAAYNVRTLASEWLEQAPTETSQVQQVLRHVSELVRPTACKFRCRCWSASRGCLSALVKNYSNSGEIRAHA